MRAILRLGILGALAGCGGTAGNGAVAADAEPSLAAADGGRAMRALGGTGSIDVQMMWLTDWTDVDTLHFAVTGPNGSSSVVRMGEITTSGREIIDYVITEVPAADCYGLTLSGVHANTTCNAGVGAFFQGCFGVVAASTTGVSVTVGSGDLLCNVAYANCPVIQSLGVVLDGGGVTDAGTGAGAVGTTVLLEATAVGPNPGALAFAWSSSNAVAGSLGPAGPLSSAPEGGMSATSSFTCRAPGTTTITVVVSDGPTPDGGACSPSFTTLNFALVCGNAPPEDAGAYGDAGHPDGVAAEDATGSAD